MSRALFLSTYPPRECGIATFTRDLSDAVQKKFGGAMQPKIIAMEDDPTRFRVYPKKVVSKILESSIASYSEAAEKINSMHSFDVLNIQHEFGIFGGDYGRNILRLMKAIDKKIVTTMHTILEKPEDGLRRTVRKIAKESDRIVVMTEKSKNVLSSDYGIPPEKISVIPHGVPNVDSSDVKQRLKKKYGLLGSRVLLTFGMLSRGKALDIPIKAMPAVLKEHPDAVYLIAGETHPKVREEEGESYRNELLALVHGLGLENSVKFLDRYLSIGEIVDLLRLSDIYLAPSLDPRQSCSGTVSYAMAAGRAIVSSRSMYNGEVLSGNRGAMIPANSPSRFAKRIKALLGNDSERKEMGRNAFVYSRAMTWPNVAMQYYSVFSELAGKKDSVYSRLPRISFRHFSNLCDDFGMVQFSDYSNPVPETGYTLDDNARALSVSAKAYALGRKASERDASKFLSFIEHCQLPDGRFHNEIDVNREFSDDLGSEDSFGRAVSALGEVLSGALPEQHKLRAKKILSNYAQKNSSVESPRAEAHSLMGLVKASDSIPGLDRKIPHLVDSLVSKFDANSSGEWRWFEKYMTYGNSVIPEALFEASSVIPDSRAANVALCSAEFLERTHFVHGKLIPVGQEKWFLKDSHRSIYDQQPIEAAGMTLAFIKAYNSTREKRFVKRARDSFEWFLGRNTLNQMVYDDSTGGCFDGITRDGVNMNQGAESTVCYLNARLSVEQLHKGGIL